MKSFLFKVNPAAKIIGGRMKLKNEPSSNSNVSPSNNFVTIKPTNAPAPIPTVDS